MEPQEKPEFVIRPGTPADLGFVYATWLKDYSERSSFAKRIRPATFKKFHTLLVDRCLKNSALLVAVDPDAPNVIFGYIVCQAPSGPEGLPVLSYVFVKRAFRLRGIARALFAAAGLREDSKFIFNHLTYVGESLWKRLPHGEFSPYHV